MEGDWKTDVDDRYIDYKESGPFWKFVSQGGKYASIILTLVFQFGKQKDSAGSCSDTSSGKPDQS